MSTSEHSQTQSDQALTELASWLRAVGDPIRIHTLRLLARDAFGVQELCHLLDSKQPSLSHHLKILLQAGLVTTRRERTTVFYRRDPSGALAGTLKHRLLAEIDAQPLPADIELRLQEIHQLRSEASRRFFAEQAAVFKTQQEQIAEFQEYGPLVSRRAIRHGGGIAIEVGPGDGDLLPLLSPHFSQVIALDNSPEMLQHSRQAAAELNNIVFTLGDVDDSNNPPELPLADVIVMNMVLHHVPNPQRLLTRLCHLLKDDGRLIVTELCAHDQDWVRDACGDAWLGFDSDELISWLSNGGLTSVSADYLALRNGFRVQIHEFTKSPITRTLI
ncbi:MAG: metalloregulator ArsR/SmtB family transcription factor [Moraxellaceae bacterium]|nr:metalloregulator ArsR/SmtB family transcription factor [Moraxellaceae bacterium]MDZ4386143.1 metalloregulator ArsR/SmtB family transcription factor [Moraxellaceae bacterium]